jgi:hypothetical protein
MIVLMFEPLANSPKKPNYLKLNEEKKKKKAETNFQ